MQTLQQFGQSIKSKYPEYNDISDEELGTKMLSKYPQYADMVQDSGSILQKQKSQLRNDKLDQGAIESAIDMGGHGVYDIPVAGGVLRALTHPFVKAAELAGQAGGEALTAATGGTEAPQIASPDTLRTIGGYDKPRSVSGTALQGTKDIAALIPYLLGMGANSGLATKAPLVGGAISKLPGIAPQIANLAASGGLAQGLNSFSQPNSTVGSTLTGAAIGAVANPAMAGAQNLLTDKLPRYLGMRAYGNAGTHLPEVREAEKAAEASGQTLKEVRQQVLSENGTGSVNKADIRGMVEDLANEEQWTGTPGVKDAIKDIKKDISTSDTLFDIYNKIKNRAYAGPINENDKVDKFLVALSGQMREHLINSSDNPNLVRTAMDNYANQTAMGKGLPSLGSTALNKINDQLQGAGPEAGILAALGVIAPSLLSGPAGLLLGGEAALSNKFVGPKLAGGLLKGGEMAANNPAITDILQRLGVQGVNSMFNSPKRAQ